MKLKIRVAGLCLLVRDATDRRVSVLLAQTGTAAPHAARIEFTGTPYSAGRPSGRFSLHLGQSEIGLPTVIWPPDGIIDISLLARGYGADLKALEQTATSRLVAWIDVPITGSLTLGPTCTFTVNGIAARFEATNHVTWTIDNVDPGQIYWEHGAFTTTPSRDQVNPGAGATEIHLTISHCPTGDDKKIDLNQPSPHFHKYYDLLTDGNGGGVQTKRPPAKAGGLWVATESGDDRLKPAEMPQG